MHNPTYKTARVCIYWVLSIPALGSAQDPFPYETEIVAPGVFAYIEPEVRGIVSGTVVAIVGDESVLVFDATHRVSTARSIIADLRKRTTKPVKYIVNSHWHEDHWAGNAEFAAAYPQAVFLAHPFTAQVMAKRRESFRGEPCETELRAEFPPLQQQIASGKRADGTTIDADGIALRKRLVNELNGQIAECDQMRYRGSDATFTDQMTISLGDRTVELMYLGRANTAGDVLAYLPAENVLLTGDIVVAPIPFATKGYIREWADVLDKLLAMRASIIVPGHGPVMRDDAYVKNMATLMRTISSQVHSLYQPNLSTDAIRTQLDIAALRDVFTGNDPALGASFDVMIMQLAVDRAIEEEQGTLSPDG